MSFFIILSGVLSGFNNYGANVKCSLKVVWGYIVKKLKRLYPLYCITMLIALGGEVVICADKVKWFEVIRCFLLIQPWFPSGYFALNGVAWFVSTIMVLYLCTIPLEYVLNKIRNAKCSKLIYSMCIISCLGIVGTYCYLTRNTNMEYTQYVFPLARVGEYICGLAAGCLIRPLKDNINYSTDKKYLCTIFELLAIVGIVIIWFLPVKTYFYRSFQWIIPNLVLITVYALEAGRISKIFSNKILVYLGNISFQCYLIHDIILRIIRKIFDISNINGVQKVVGCILSLLLVIAIGVLIDQVKLKKA